MEADGVALQLQHLQNEASKQAVAGLAHARTHAAACGRQTTETHVRAAPQNWHVIVPGEAFTLLSGGDTLTTYTFETGVAKVRLQAAQRSAQRLEWRIACHSPPRMPAQVLLRMRSPVLLQPSFQPWRGSRHVVLYRRGPCGRGVVMASTRGGSSSSKQQIS
jgi:hypothetical protein